MSRFKGTFLFGANLEVGTTVPLDARQMVGTYADLTLPATWCFSPSCANMALYNGAIVAVGADPIPANNGIYWLCDSANYNLTCSWMMAGSGSGTLTGATNGLHLINNSRSVVLGGALTGNTCIGSGTYTLGVNVNALRLTGSTSVSIGGPIKFISAPASGSACDALLVWDSGDNIVKQVSASVVNVCNVNTTYTTTSADNFIGVSGASLVCLIAAPATGQRVTVADVCGIALTNPITICGGGKYINDGLISTINTNYGSVTFVYHGKCWSAVAFVN